MTVRRGPRGGRRAARRRCAELGIDKTGSIAVENIDLSLSARADKAEEEAPGEGADAVVWEQLAEATHEESTLTVTYLAFLTVATMLAACGVMLDNAILIVGAMAVGPEFGPLAGVCTAPGRSAPRGWSARSLVALVGRLRRGDAGDGGLRLLMDGLGLFTQARLFEAAAPQHQLHLAARLVLLRRGLPRRHRRDALADLGEVRRAGRRGDLGDHGPGRRQRRAWRFSYGDCAADVGLRRHSCW